MEAFGNNAPLGGEWVEWIPPVGLGGGAPPVYPGGVLYRWNGGAWVKAKLMTRVGGAWVAKPLYRWDGAGWLEIDATG